MTKKTVKPSRVALYVVLLLLVVVYLLPAYLTLITALKDPSEISLPRSWDFPEIFNWQSFVEAFALLKPNIINSFILTICATAISIALGSINGYVFSKWKFKGSELIFTLLLFGMFIPYQVILIPLFQTLRAMNLYGGLPGLILAHVVYGLPITSLIFRNFYMQIPDSLVESATLDGAGFFSIYTQVIFPLSIPGFVVTSIWQSTQIWNEFLWGITLTRHSANPITVGLAQLAGGQAVSWNLPMAGSILAALPVLFIYIVMGRYFIRGLLAGSVKG
ncbi:carbohydrate ABC transporter permease [uncultured Cohaesibacter sp.]|uniref:carbohydrate ABC transporter permease n=1 Tax=uncultured Cohaesibacter sp. TaxID=1002546 RepID=UPI0029C92AF7|nr:carbohydrate ABC transporter permease [uncultured Cohaesibacter sp.]